LNLKLFIKKNVQLSRCPNCNTIASLRRSRSRNIWERFMKKLKVSPYFCQSCGWRGRLFTYKLSRNFVKLIILYLFLMTITAYIVQKFLKSYFD